MERRHAIADYPFAPILTIGRDGARFEERGKGWSDADIAFIAKEVEESIPVAFRNDLATLGWKNFISLWPTDVDFDWASIPREANDDKNPLQRGLPEHFGGLNDWNTQKLFVSRFRRNEAPTHANDDTIEKSLPEMIQALRHEIAHACMVLDPSFIDNIFAHAVTADTMRAGGYDGLRDSDYQFFTPTPSSPQRDILEIWAESLAHVWGGGQTNPDIFEKTYPTCMKVARAFNAHRIRLYSCTNDRDAVRERKNFIADMTREIQKTETAHVQSVYASNLSYVASIAYSDKPQHLAMAPLLSRISSMGESVCGWGVPLRNDFISPNNCAGIMLFDLLRRSAEAKSATELHSAWHGFVRDLPQNSPQTRELAIDIAADILDYQKTALSDSVGGVFAKDIEKSTNFPWLQHKSGLGKEILRACEGKNRPCSPSKTENRQIPTPVLTAIPG